MNLLLIMSLILMIMVLIGVAFLTLLERKVLGYIQIRKGPNKIYMLGFTQPFSDALKLFSKGGTYPKLSNYLMYYFSPIFSLFLSLFIWMCMPYFMKFYSFNLGLLFFLCCASMGVYSIMISGWSSNSNYSLLGSLRSVAQTVSYEVSLSLIMISLIILILSFNINLLNLFQNFIWFMFFCSPLLLCWVSSSMAETNRTPFDFAEGESELVSGFNVEYSSGSFALIFLAEYSSILFMSMMICMLFFGGSMGAEFFFKISLISFLFVWVRGSLPRFRYDKLMSLAWKSYLPLSLNMMMFYLLFKVMLMSIMLS